MGAAPQIDLGRGRVTTGQALEVARLKRENTESLEPIRSPMGPDVGAILLPELVEVARHRLGNRWTPRCPMPDLITRAC